jgi:hypothetical protein
MLEIRNIDGRFCLNLSVFFLAGIIFFSTAAVSQEISLKELPDIPCSELISYQHPSPENLTAEYRIYLPEKSTFLEITRRVQEVTQNCVQIMKDAGWELKKEDWFRRGGEFHLTKNIVNEVKMSIAPYAKAMEGKKRDFIKISFDLKRLIPYEDVLGIDYPDVPRYPGSIRVRWMDLLGDYAVKYLVLGKIEEVEIFYKQNLPDFGWQPTAGTATLNYSKGGYKSKEAAPVEKKDIQQPGEKVKKMIPTTLGIHLNEDQGIVEIGIGRSSGSEVFSPVEPLSITPEKSLPSEKKEILTYIDPDQDIPIHPLLIKQHSERLPLDTQGNETFRMTFNTEKVDADEAVNIAKFYLDKMENTGWEVLDDEWYGLGRTLLFRKGAVKVKAAVKAVGRWPIPERAPKINIPVEIDVIFSIPTRETAGTDIENVPRFPDSVRFYYLEAGLDHTVKYKACASVKEVEWYFVEELPAKGWIFSGYDMTGLLFVPSDTAKSAAGALSKGKLIPTTLKLKVDDRYDGTVKIGLTKTKGD